MPRSKRHDYPGAWHHVMNRGARRRKIFFDDKHCLKFMDILDEAVERFGIEIHAYSLIPNHYHLLIRTPEGNLSSTMRHINGVYTQWLNFVKKWDGPLFRGRYTSQLIEEEEYLRVVLAYIHLNPLQARLVKRLDSEAWTSHRAYLGKDSVPQWLSTRFMTRLFGDSYALHAFVRSFYTKSVEYPGDFNPETGLFKRKAIVKQIMHYNQKPELLDFSETPRFSNSDVVLERVMRISGSKKEDILTSTKGPGANPARRFAIWALSHKAGLSHREIATTLFASQHQVAKVLSRMRNNVIRPPVKDWIERFHAAE